MKKLAIFDFDGTLFNSIDDVVICFNRALTDYGLPTLTRDEYIPCLGGNIDEIVSLVLGENSTPENIESVKETYLDYYRSSKKENTLPFPDSKKTLEKLQDKGILLAINSNRLDYSLEYFIGKFFSDIDFVDIEGHSYPHPSKPDPYGVNKIIEKAGVGLDDAVYIGDSSTDIRTAQNSRIDCLMVKWGYGNQDDYENRYPVSILSDFSEILEYFK